MTALRLVAIALVLTTTPALAQSPGEIAFWESVRDSRNPVELQAYIDNYPNGAFVVLAKSRLAALQKPAPVTAPVNRPAPPPTPAVTALAAPASRYPVAGDTWTYRLSYPRLRGQWGQQAKPAATHVVQADTVSEAEILDRLVIDGGSPRAARHGKGGYLVDEGVSLFSPYLVVFEKIAPGQRLPSVRVLDAACQSNYRCQASAGRVEAETITVPAGRFETFKVTIEQQWMPFTAYSTTGSVAADMTGGRTLTVWYSPQVKRAVRYSSRLVSGAVPPMDANYDLELISFALK